MKHKTPTILVLVILLSLGSLSVEAKQLDPRSLSSAIIAKEKPGEVITNIEEILKELTEKPELKKEYSLFDVEGKLNPFEFEKYKAEHDKAQAAAEVAPVCDKHEQVLSLLQSKEVGAIYGEGVMLDDLMVEIAEVYGVRPVVESRFGFGFIEFRCTKSLPPHCAATKTVLQLSPESERPQDVNADTNLAGDYKLLVNEFSIDKHEYARYRGDYIAHYGVDAFNQFGADLAYSFSGTTGTLYKTASEFVQVDTNGEPLPLEPDALRQLGLEVQDLKKEFCSDGVTVDREFEIYRLHRVIGFFEMELQYSILGSPRGSIDERTPASHIRAVANIFEVSADEAGRYPGVVGEIQSKIEDLFPVGTDLSSVLAEQDYIREILHFARYLLAKFIAENPPVLIHKDLTVEGDLTVKGKTVVGHTIVDGSLKVAEGLKAASISSKTSHFETAGIHQASIDDASIDHARIVDLSTKGIVSLELSAESAHINHFQGQTMKVDDLYADNLSVREIGVDDIAMKQARAEVLDAGSIYVDHSIRAQRAEFAGLGAKAASFSQLAAAKAEITNGMVLGYDAKVAEHSSSAALGSGSEVSGHNSFAIGTDHHLTENHSIAIGSGLKKLEADSVVIGFDKPGLAVVKATGANLDDSILLSLRKRLERIDRTINRYQAYANNPRYRRWSSYYRSMVERFEQQKQGYLARYDARLQELHLDASSRVGIGTTQPEQSLHISGAMKLEPMDHAPADPSLGTIYMSSDNAVCVYMADGWEVMAGDGECFSYQTTGVGRRGNRSGRGGTARR